MMSPIISETRGIYKSSTTFSVANVKTPLLTKQKMNSDSPKYRTPNKLNEIMTTKIAAR